MKFSLTIAAILGLLININLFCQNTINYNWHKGVGYLKTELIIDGEFKYKEAKNDLPAFQVKDIELKETKKVMLPMFRKLVLVGTEPGVSSRKDTTLFVWVEQYEDLMRVVREGEIDVYDNSKIINENYSGLDSYFLVAERQGFGIKTIRKVSDLENLMKNKPYFLKSAKATGKIESRDFRVIVYLIDLFNDKDPMRVLQWKQAFIKTKKGESLNGYAYIQPMDIRNEYNTDKFAYIHYYDEKGFRIFRNDELEQLNINNITYETGYYGLTNKYFFGRKWNFEGQEYLVSSKITNRNSYFYISRNNNEMDYIILKEVSGTFLKPENEMMLRKQYFLSVGAP